MGFVKRAWKGETKLWIVFWLFGVAVTTVGFIAFGLLMGILLGVLSMTGAPLIVVKVLGILVIIIPVIYYIWNAVSLWRCAWNAKLKIWGYIVRVLVVLGVVSTIWSIASAYMMRDDMKKMQANQDGWHEIPAHGMQMQQAQPAPVVPPVNPAAATVNLVPTPAPSPVVQPAPQVQNSIPEPQIQSIAPQPAQVAPVQNVMPTNPAVTATIPVVVPSPSAPKTPEELNKAACIKDMTSYAAVHYMDAGAYIAKNQPILEQCIQQKAATQH